MEPPSKTTGSTSSQIIGVLQTKSAMALIRGGLSFFYIKLLIQTVLGDILTGHVRYNRQS